MMCDLLWGSDFDVLLLRLRRGLSPARVPGPRDKRVLFGAYIALMKAWICDDTCDDVRFRVVAAGRAAPAPRGRGVGFLCGCGVGVGFVCCCLWCRRVCCV